MKEDLGVQEYGLWVYWVNLVIHMVVQLKQILCWSCSNPQICKTSGDLFLTNHVCKRKVGEEWNIQKFT